MEVGDKIGKALKIDSKMALATRGEYVRVCVEIDLKKPLLLFIWINRELQPIEYKGLSQICFECGQ